MIRVKICGITSRDDALTAVDAGADALGFVFHPPSPRYVTPERAGEIIAALPPLVQTVGLFVNAPLEKVNAVADGCGLDLVQLHGDETPEYCAGVRRRVLKAFRIKDMTSLEPIPGYLCSAYLLDAWSPDAYGGTGRTFNWDLAREAKRFGAVVLAGGLTPENVAEAVRQVAPYGVDVSGGVEAAPGKKDPEKVKRFIAAAKGW
jgi:phosphoribosylanthranilate isomerase